MLNGTPGIIDILAQAHGATITGVSGNGLRFDNTAITVAPTNTDALKNEMLRILIKYPPAGLNGLYMSQIDDAALLEYLRAHL